LNATARSRQDYIATYNPATKKVQRLRFVGFDEPRGYNSHGMDVVPNKDNPSELFVYLVNQRPPVDETSAGKVYADPSIEVFKTTVGGQTLTHIRTYEDPNVIKSPNDIVGSNDGKSFWFTNDGTHVMRFWTFRPQLFLGRRYASVGYCHADNGCKIATDNLSGSNGITHGPGDTLMVASTTLPEIVVLEKQADGSAVLTDVIKLEAGDKNMPVDNIVADSNGVVWGAGYPEIARSLAHFLDYRVPSAVSALRISINTGRSSFFGEKYTIELPFNDDGQTVSGSTTVVHDAERGKLFFSGVMSPGISVCEFKDKQAA
jgi:hypothetical protein